MKTCVFYVSNFDDFKYLKLSIHTLRKYYKEDVFIITDGCLITQAYQSFATKYSLKFIDCESLFKKTFTNSQVLKVANTKFTIYTMYRLLFPFIDEFYKYDRVLYLDTDTLILDDISQLFNKTMQYGYGLIYNQTHGKSLYERCVIQQYEKLYEFDQDIVKPTSYDNAGVVLFDYNTIRSNFRYYKDKITKLNQIYSRQLFRLNDQCVLNLFFKHDVFLAQYDYRYNHNNIQDSIIYHYSGSNKDKNLRDAKIKYFLINHKLI